MADAEQGHVGPYHDEFFDDQGGPRLARCAVLFVDLLGISQLARSENAATYLRTLNDALRSSRDFLREDSPWPAAYFSDSLVIVSPVAGGSDCSALTGLIEQAAALQIDLLSHGYALRGGIAMGEIHLSRNLMFGPGLIEAYQLEQRSALDPRIILSQAAAQTVRSGPGDEVGELGWSLLEDQDGHLVVDYLASSIVSYRLEPARDGLEWHRDFINRRRAEHQSDIAVWSKWNWVAQYHNAVCARLEGSSPELLVSNVGARRFAPFAP